ncbi:hypothetical protein CHARACLAT_033311 [Characodon lateralis]|uniref:Uncharacterized protein n=1 Tax=Characodon lateralis TaxID=208331 RepID=A0ABU7CXA2_9TELE|nr:hypothetical protein [Characodon lateralis]
MLLPSSCLHFGPPANHNMAPFSRLNQQISLETKPLVGFSPAPGVGVVFDRYMNLLIFLYQREFQLSSSSRTGLVEHNTNTKTTMGSPRHCVMCNLNPFLLFM